MAVKSFWTTSRLKVWWYSGICGYDVKVRRRVPSMSVLGEIYYEPVWFLGPSRKALEGHIVKKGPSPARPDAGFLLRLGAIAAFFTTTRVR